MSFNQYLKEALDRNLVIKFDNKLEADKSVSYVTKFAKDILDDLINVTYDGEVIFRPRSQERYEEIKNLFLYKTDGKVV